jgi:hypothetical protein
MSTLEIILETYPELTDADFHCTFGKIGLFDDGDGVQYIGKWNYSKPIPEGLKLGK